MALTSTNGGNFSTEQFLVLPAVEILQEKFRCIVCIIHCPMRRSFKVNVIIFQRFEQADFLRQLMDTSILALQINPARQKRIISVVSPTFTMDEIHVFITPGTNQLRPVLCMKPIFKSWKNLCKNFGFTHLIL